MERAGEGDVVDVVPGMLGERPLLPPAGHPPVDEPGIVLEQHLRPEPEPLHHAGTEALDQAVGVAGELTDPSDAFLGLEVDPDDGGARAAEHVELGRDDRRPVLALDPDDGGAMIGEHHPGERRRADPGELDDADSLQRPCHDGLIESADAPRQHLAAKPVGGRGRWSQYRFIRSNSALQGPGVDPFRIRMLLCFNNLR